MDRTMHKDRRPAKAMGVILLFVFSGAAWAQDLDFPGIQAAGGGVTLSSGSHQMVFLVAEFASSLMTSGVHRIESGLSALFGQGAARSVAQCGQGISATVDSRAGAVTVSAPAGALPDGTVVNVQVPTTVPGSGDAGLRPIADTAVEILAGSQPLAPVTLAFSYAGADLQGADPSLFVVAWHDPGRDAWVPLPSTVDAAGKRVFAQTSHFSLFQVMQQTPSSTVAAARVYPNPLRPALGQTAMIFTQLPAGARVRLYTLTGVLVKDLNADASGTTSWDGTNQSGRSVASGVYFAFCQGAGEKRTFKVAVQR